MIDVRPRGVARVLPDNRYGTQLGINFGERSIFQLGDNGRISFGHSGGIESVLTGSAKIPVCRGVNSGLHVYAVDMINGGWLDFSGNNRIELNPNNVVALGSGSKIDGRLDIQTEGTAAIGATGDMTLPNADINAAQGITLSGTGAVEIGNLRNQGSSSTANQGININARGAVTIGVVDGNDDFAVTAGGDITITEIKNADSISLTITPPTAGVIKIGGRRTTDNPVICAPTDNCNGFELADDGGSSGDDCNTVNSDPGVANNCGGGATGPGFCLLLSAVALLRRLRDTSGRNADGVHLRLSGLYNAPRRCARNSRARADS